MKEMFKKIDWKNILERAFWTFWEGFLLGIPANVALAQYTDVNALKKAIILVLFGALGSGISAVKTLVLEIIREYKGVPQEASEAAQEDKEN